MQPTKRDVLKTTGTALASSVGIAGLVSQRATAGGSDYVLEIGSASDGTYGYEVHVPIVTDAPSICEKDSGCVPSDCETGDTCVNGTRFTERDGGQYEDSLSVIEVDGEKRVEVTGFVGDGTETGGDVWEVFDGKDPIEVATAGVEVTTGPIDSV